MRFRWLWRGPVVAATLCLAGCFASRAPLIAPADADTPIADGVSLTEFINCDGEAGSLLGCHGYQKRGAGAKLTLKDGVYTLHPEPDPALASVFPGGQVKDVVFMLKKVGPDLYVMQLPFADTGPKVGPQYVYELMRVDGGAVYLYELNCEQNGDQAYVRSGALAKISDALLVPTCEPASLDGLGKVFADRIANGARPDEKFEIGPEA